MLERLVWIRGSCRSTLTQRAPPALARLSPPLAHPPHKGEGKACTAQAVQSERMMLYFLIW